MKTINKLSKSHYILATLAMTQSMSCSVAADIKENSCKIYTASRVFDGTTLYAEEAPTSVVVDGERIYMIAPASDITVQCKKVYDLGDATIMPGFIESHAHMSFQNVPADIVLNHGITTVRDVGGLITEPTGGIGALRQVNTGPIIQAAGGYPLNLFGGHGDEEQGDNDHHAATIAVIAEDAAHAIEHVEHIARSGAVAIKVALEKGGEHGAPWSGGHGHDAGDTDGPVAGEWPILSEEVLTAVVTRAHELGLPVIAHAGEQVGFDLAVKTGVDELAHIPCAEVTQESLTAAVAAGMRFQTTSDTLSSCLGITANIHGILHAEQHLLEAGHIEKPATIIYASEIGHDDVPYGVNGQELVNNLLNFAGHNPVDFSHVMRVIKGATSVPGALIGEQIGEPLLGTLEAGAPADIIAVKGNAFERFKLIEYPSLVVSGGEEVLNNFK